MDAEAIERCRAFLQAATEAEIAAERDVPSRLLLDAREWNGRTVAVGYAPFEPPPPEARLVLAGLAPTPVVVKDMLTAARLRPSRRSPANVDEIVRMVRYGRLPAQKRLTRSLYEVGLARYLGLPTDEGLLLRAGPLVHMTWLLPYPVWVDGEHREVFDHPLAVPVLEEMLHKTFVPLMREAQDAIFVPLGKPASALIRYAAEAAGVSPQRVLPGLPNPMTPCPEEMRIYRGTDGGRPLWRRKYLGTWEESSRVIGRLAGVH